MGVEDGGWSGAQWTPRLEVRVQGDEGEESEGGGGAEEDGGEAEEREG